MRWTVENVGLLLLLSLFVGAAGAGVLQGPTGAPQPVETDLQQDGPTATGQQGFSKVWSTEQRDSLSEAVVEEINAFRSEHGKSNLTESASLDDAAAGHAQYLNQVGEVKHEGEEGTSPDQRVGSCYSGEVITGVLTKTSVDATAQATVRHFIESPPHREVLLEGSHSSIGVGVAAEEDGETLRVVVDFCR